MKIAIDRTVIVAPNQHPFQTRVQQDGYIAIEVTHDGTRVVMLLSPEEAVHVGVQLVQQAPIAGGIREMIARGIDPAKMQERADAVINGT